MIKISSLISLYRCERFLDDFLVRLSKQSIIDDIEFIFILNDDSNGFIDSRIKDFNFKKKVIKTPLENLYKSWNRGIEISEGEYLCNLNCDDYHYYRSLEILSKGLDLNKDVSLCSGRCIGTDQKVNDFDERNLDNCNIEIDKDAYYIANNRHCGPSPMWRKNIHDSVGLFDEQYRAAGDHEMWIRMLKSGASFIRTDIPTVIYYDRPDTLSNLSSSANEINKILSENKGYE